VGFPLGDSAASDLEQSVPTIAHLLPTNTHKINPHLAAIVVAWPELPQAIKAGIIAIVRSALES
jgi:hypothetical protein